MSTRLLSTLKNDPTAFVAFYKYAGDHLVLDSLNFLLDAHEFKALPPFMRTQKEEQIVSKYIKTTSKFCVNVTHRIRDNILDKYGSGRLNIFDKAIDSCNTLLEDESFPDFKANYRPENHPAVSIKGKSLISSLSTVVTPEMIGSCLFLLTGQRPKKEDIKRQALNQEAHLKKWLLEGEGVPQVLWVALNEDLDPVALSSIFALYSPFPAKIQEFLKHSVQSGFAEGSCMLSELDSAETILKEYTFSVGKTWWTKVLKKVTESIYKEEIASREGGASKDKLYALVSSVLTNLTSDSKIPTGIKYVLVTVFQQAQKMFPKEKKEKIVLSAGKVLLDAICTLICTPDKAPFDVSIKDAIITRGNAVLVAEGIRCLVEGDSESLSRSPDTLALCQEVKVNYSKIVFNWLTLILTDQSVKAEIKAETAASKSENDINLIGHYLATNAQLLLKAFDTRKLGALATFLESNNKDGTGTAESYDEDNKVGRFPGSAHKATKGFKGGKGSSSMLTPTLSLSSLPNNSKFPPNTPIEKLVRYIVSEKLQIPVDPNKFASILKEECIFKVGHLQMLPPSELGSINLPVLLRHCLSEHCNTNATSAFGSPMSPHGQQRSFGAFQGGDRLGFTSMEGQMGDDRSEESDTEGGNLSNTFGLSIEERTAVRKSWMLLHKKVADGVKIETPAGAEPISRVFYSTLWEEWIKLDPVADTMFKLRSRKEREIHVNRILGHVMGALDDPSVGKEKIRNLGIQHCIWNIQNDSFGALSISFAKALQTSLGKEIEDETKNAWATLLSAVGGMIVERYDKIKIGRRGHLQHKQGGSWKKYSTLITHDTLSFFKSKDEKKPKIKLLFQHATDVDTIDDETKLDSPTPYAFSVAFGTITKYFCANNSEEFKDWIDNINWRIKAFIRLKVANETDGVQKLTTAEMKRMKIKQAPTESKAEKAANKVLRYRKHIDAQIKTTSDFALFDSLVSCTIVIDVKGTISYANEAAASLFGYKSREIIGRNVKTLMPPQYSQNHDQYLENYLTTGKKKVIGLGRDLPILCKDGTEKTCNLTVVDHQQTGTRYFIGTLVPPSDHSSTSESGDAGKNFSIFDKMLQPTISINKEGIVEYVNDSVTKLTGYPKKDLVGKNISILMTTKKAVVHDSYLQNYLKTGVKKVIGVGRAVDVRAKEGNVIRCILTVTEHFQGGIPFFMGTLQQSADASASSSMETASMGDVDPYALFENLLDATVVIGFDAIIVYTNSAIVDITGYRPQELIGKNVNVLMPPLIARRHDGYLKAYARSGIKHILGKGREVTVLHKNQQQYAVHLSVTEHESGGQTQFIGTLTPHKAEFKLYDNLLDCTIVINEQGIVQYANEAVKKISGYRPSALIGKNVKILMPQEYAVKHDRYLKAYMTTGKKKIIGTGRALPLLSRSGTVVSSHLSVVESKSAGARIFVGTLRTKQDEEEAQEMKLLNMTRHVFQDVANPCIVITKRGNIKVFNQAAESALGYKYEEISGKNIKMMMPEEYAIGHDSYLRKYLKTGESKIVGAGRMVPFLLSDKSVKNFYLSVSLKKKEDKILYFIGILSTVFTVEVLKPGTFQNESEESQ